MSDPQSKSTNWFGSLQLAYKYIVVFCGLLVLVFCAGLVKVFFDRRKLKAHVKKDELESGPKEDTVELNHREKDEGDLFGIRAIEAGFYAGVAQSRPVSRAGSVIGHPATMSSSTLVGGGVNSPLMKGQSTNASVLSLNLGQGDANSSQRTSHPLSKLRPSEAELTGKHGAVDMSLQVPPSPGHPRGGSPTFGGSEDGYSDGFNTPRSASPRGPDYHPQHYAPAPTIPMPDALQVTYHDVNDANAQSQAASFNSTPSQSPTPPYPGNPPATRLPTLPTNALRKESRSPSPEQNYPRVRLDLNMYGPIPDLSQVPEPAQAPSAPTPAPQTMAATHKRESDASSLYSQTRLSTFDAYQAYQKQNPRITSASSTDYGFSSISTDDSRGNSFILNVENTSQPTLMTPPAASDSRLSVAPDSNSRLSVAPGNSRLSVAPDASRLSVLPNGQEQRLSEFYDAYYRHSQIAPDAPVVPADGNRLVARHSTIVEVDTPLASPMYPKNMQFSPPGAAF